MENKKIGWYENNELLDQLKELKKHQEKQRKIPLPDPMPMPMPPITPLPMPAPMPGQYADDEVEITIRIKPRRPRYPGITYRYGSQSMPMNMSMADQLVGQ